MANVKYTPSPYYKAPDGQDLIGKLAYVNKYAAPIGMVMGVMDAQFLSKPKGYLGVLGRVLYWAAPAVGMSTAFVCTTYIATNIRQKDDSINSALGGIIAGSIYGTWRRSYGTGIAAAIVLGITAAIKKEAAINNYILILKHPDVQVQTVGATRYDLTITPEIPGNWTTGRKEE